MRLISCYTVYTEKQLSEGRADGIVEADKRAIYKIGAGFSSRTGTIEGQSQKVSDTL